MGGKFSKLLHPLYNLPGPASFFPWGKPMTYALTSQQAASGITVHVSIGENWGARDPHTLGEASFSFFFSGKALGHDKPTHLH